PELTADRFVANPFCRDGQARMYKTGDVARYRPDGNIEFLGRADFQVKIRGFRIELGEIEANLDQHPGVRQAVVMARQAGTKTDDKQLVAYLVPETDTRPNTNELREFLRQELPDYMLPASFMWLDRLPVNPAGKIDRQALPEPDTSRPELQIEFVTPRNKTEETLAEIFAGVLGLDQVGVYDNFFDLGGASIQSLEIGALAKSRNLHVTPAMLFQYPTIAELAEVATPAMPAGEADAVACHGNGNGTLVAPGEISQASPRVRKSHSSSVRQRRETKKSNAIIESMGVYLPPKVVTTKELLKGCKKKMWFPLERMTGIHSRRMAGETEFSIDLAKKAVIECLQHSKYGPADIDVVIACNITRLDGVRHLSVEPNTSVQLRSHFGFDNAFAIDIANACSGMFTAISVVEAMLETGLIRRGLVVSGEYITEISKTAQLEIDSFMDSRMACLTVGDAGAAVLLEAASNRDVGFHELEMYSLSKYARLCIGKLTDQPHGGAIMYVPDPMEHTAVAVHHSVMHAKYTFENSPWKPEDMDHMILHQTSDRSLRDAKRAINKAFRRNVCNDDNTIHNIAERGNTATTTQMVAVWDNIISGNIKSGERVLFGITGSGQTIGTGIYTFDDLPDRIRHNKQNGQHPEKRHSPAAQQPPRRADVPRVQVHSAGMIPLGQPIERDTPKMTALAATECLRRSSYECNDIELLIYGSVSRTGYISEPAIATLIARELEMNDTIASALDQKTFAFDVFNGGMGVLNACHVATQMIQAGTFGNAMITASEVEVNEELFGELSGVYETASALILEPSSDGHRGFGQFLFKYFPQFSESRVVTGAYREGKPYLNFQVRPELNDHWLQCIPDVIHELLEREGLDISQIKIVLPPQFSSKFNRQLAGALGVPNELVVDVDHGGKDLFTSSLPYAFDHALEKQLVQPGDIGLIINVASGIQVGCATYYF
ncbi:MAG TPA: 3-oxoacyl-[acyl-carrier-protein] synthase III C-terminal domain-containing protein, partial [Pirellulales bacterium]|nr:3-oxoacyl-[acyl-carrier-protein] synthase III C-terminal domain-containing protein [Pirellulales bacterium]